MQNEHGQRDERKLLPQPVVRPCHLRRRARRLHFMGDQWVVVHRPHDVWITREVFVLELYDVRVRREVAEAFEDGWFCTGDLGYLDDDGYLYVLDRRSDLIISGGENVYPAEIESVLLAHPAVAEAGVCGQPDPQWGQVTIAFIKARPGQPADAESILMYARQRLARYKVPRTIHFVEELPRNSSGKLLRRELPGLLPGNGK